MKVVTLFLSFILTAFSLITDEETSLTIDVGASRVCSDSFAY